MEKPIWHIVKDSARKIGLSNLAPHDLWRTCARLCQAAGGELEQIRFLLGHISIQTTERYLGFKQRNRAAVNDRIGIEPFSQPIPLIRMKVASPLGTGAANVWQRSGWLVTRERSQLSFLLTVLIGFDQD